MDRCVVLSVGKNKGGTWIEVDNTSLRIAGGGQPSDRGELVVGQKSYKILEVRKTDSGYSLRLEDDVELDNGDVVYCKLDEDYRHLLSRMHTGEHILSRALEITIPGLKIVKAELGEDSSVIFVESPLTIDWDFIFRAERLANSVIHEGRNVFIETVRPEEARQVKGLRIKWDRIEDDFVRLVRVEGFDVIACSGTHVNNTREVGDIIVKKFNGGKGRYEIRFELDALEKLWDYSYRIRKLESAMNMQIEELAELYDKVKQENKSFQKDFKVIAGYVDIPSERIEVAGKEFYFISMVGFPSAVLSMYLSRLHRTVNKDYIVLNVLGNEGNLCLSLPSYDQDDADRLVECLKNKLNAKGGGRGIYRLKTAERDARKVVECLRECVR
ncbi:MAG: alanyl-tRNA editing protein [Synergistetes bacterium]|nr:alanyl-tRNA editing protein [Synergistota bacterium]